MSKKKESDNKNGERPFDHESKKNENKEHVHEEGHCHCCGNPQTRFKYAFFAVILVLGCAAAEHFFNKRNYQEFYQNNKKEEKKLIEEKSKGHLQRIDELAQKIDKLHEEVAYLSSLKQLLASSESNAEQEAMQRKKWKAWIKLAEKLEQNENCTQEAEDFNKAFAEDKEILRIVNDLIKENSDNEKANENNNSNFVDVCKRYLKKIIKVKKIDSWKIREISGDILISLKRMYH